MPAERFYIDTELKGFVTLTGAEHHHLSHVMRARVGDEIELVDGKGSLAQGQIKNISKHESEIEIISLRKEPIAEPFLSLAIPFMRPSKLELVIEKCTELGADRFLIYPAAHSEKKEISEHGKERLQHILIASMKQCGRLDLPQIHYTRLEEILKLPTRIAFGSTKKEALRKMFDEPLTLITGPEKGFSEKEIQLLEQTGDAVKLHNHILRAETAPIAAAAIFSRW
jgi:16S rRNA (uracil1498-N3)-methyltransferase